MENIETLKQAHESERDRPKTIEGHLAVFHDFSDPGFVTEFHRRIIEFVNNYDANNKYPQPQRSP